MTAALLLSCITVALLLQVLAGAAFAVWRRRATADASAPVGVEEEVASAGPPSGAWSGWRDFRVVRRTFEDAAQTQCSFHLHPVDGAPLEPFQPGQYLTFSLRVPEGGVRVVGAAGGAARARTITRCYLLPGLLVLRNYHRAWLRHDVMAVKALTAVLVPMGIFYAVASGLPRI